MLLDTGLSIKTIESIQGIFKKYQKIESVFIYGSRAKGNFKNGSDIDLTIDGAELTLTDLFKIENELDDLFLPYKIDLSLIHHIESAELLEHIKRVGKVFYLKN
jgi:predicted nucleotidyltransferase